MIILIGPAQRKKLAEIIAKKIAPKFNEWLVEYLLNSNNPLPDQAITGNGSFLIKKAVYSNGCGEINFNITFSVEVLPEQPKPETPQVYDYE